MRQPKTNIKLLKTIRNQWVINPRTRIQEDERLNVKKIREESKKIIKEGEF